MQASQEYQNNVLKIAAPFIASWEGFREEPYDDSDGKSLKEKDGQCLGIVTVGYGFTEKSIGSRVHSPMKESEARTIFFHLLKKTYAAAVFIKLTREVPAPVAAALVSLSYNAGPSAFSVSEVLKAVNNGDFEGAAKICEHWRITYKGAVCKGLVNRRKTEAALIRNQFFVQEWDVPNLNPLKTFKPAGGANERK